MFTQTGKLLVTDITNSVLYEFSIGLLGLLEEPEGQVGPLNDYVVAVTEATEKFKAAFNKNSKHPLTVRIKEKHDQRTSLYIALKRQIGVALKMPSDPDGVAAAHSLKKEMQECGLWTNQNLSYSATSKLVDQLLQKSTQEPIAQWVAQISLQSLIDQLGTVQNEYETLKQTRIEDISSDMTPVESKARKNLIEALLSTLDAIDFGARRNSAGMPDIVGDVIEMIIEANARTRASVSRDQNSDNEPPVEEETPVYE